MEKIKHIFFDLDNTLWDYRKNAELKLIDLFNEYKIKENYNISFDAFYSVYYIVNESLWADFRDKKITRKELQQRRFVETFNKLEIESFPYTEEMENRLMEEVTDNQETVEGADIILPYLHEKYELHILSNGFEEITHRKINGCLIKDYVKTITTSDGAGVPKPDPIAFQTALDKAQAKRENSLYVGDDWIADMVGATQFGMKAVFFNPLDEKHNWLKDVPIIDKLVELKNHL